jgi:hypothetical protein
MNSFFFLKRWLSIAGLLLLSSPVSLNALALSPLREGILAEDSNLLKGSVQTNLQTTPFDSSEVNAETPDLKIPIRNVHKPVKLSPANSSQHQIAISTKAFQPGSRSLVSGLAAARQALLESSPPPLQLNDYPTLDPDFVDNQPLLKAGAGLSADKRRFVTLINGKIYSVSSLCSKVTPYYLVSGQLVKIDISEMPRYADKSCLPSFPYRSYSYVAAKLKGTPPPGTLFEVVIHDKHHSSYIFKPEGTLITHWAGNLCLKANGQSCGKRISALK